jgi:hypothetical protein
MNVTSQECLETGQTTAFTNGTSPTRTAANRTVEDSIAMDNLIDARKGRRKIIELLTTQQLDDSCCAERLKQVALDGKRRLLELLAGWLVSIELDKKCSVSDRGLFAAITTQVSVEGWLSLQECEAALNKKKTEACRSEEELYKVYDRVAPHGGISIVLIKGAEKVKAKKLQKEYRLAKACRESIERDLIMVREDIRKTIGRFLRNAITTQSLELLAKESSVKENLSSLIQEIEETGIAIWGAHAQKQLSSLRELQNESARLSQVYSTTN